MYLKIVDSDENLLILRTIKDRNYLGWCLAGLEGWKETPAVREEVSDFPIMDGGTFPVNYTQGSRILTIYGIASTRSNIEASNLIDQINNLFGKKLTIIGEDIHGERQVTGFLSDQPSFKFHDYERLIEFTLIITCPDPHKYSVPVTYYENDGHIVVRNAGNCMTYPVIHAEGELTDIKIEMDEHLVWWVGETNSLEIDFRSGKCSEGVLVVDDAFPIPPGTHLITVETEDEATISMDVQSAWR